MRKSSASQAIARRWWIGFLVLAITLAAAYYLTRRQAPVYEARATYITRLSDTITEGRDINTALDVLNRQNGFLTTYSELAKSRVIRTRAADRLNPSDGSLRGLPVASRVIPGTAILEITVEGRFPGQVRDYANAIGEETAAYANSLYTPYRLELLDQAQIPLRPSGPNLAFNLIIGGLLGLFIGFGMMLVSAWMSGTFREPHPRIEVEDAQVFSSFHHDIEELKIQSAALRRELSEARMIFRDTVLEARLLGDMLQEANGRKK